MVSQCTLGQPMTFQWHSSVHWTSQCTLAQGKASLCYFPYVCTNTCSNSMFVYQTLNWIQSANGPLARYEKIAGVHAPGMPGTFSPPSGTSDPDMHHGTCVTHVPWCMPGSLTSVFLWSQWRGKTFPAFPAHAQPAILRIWQEAHGSVKSRPKRKKVFLQGSSSPSTSPSPSPSSSSLLFSIFA